MEDKISARLFAHLAQDSTRSVIFRRGPSKQVCTFLWDRKRDTFELGQWLKGRIYERRSDISPDGKYLIYFAANQAKWRARTGGSWTAVTRAPWLRALDLYAKGDTWQGGGLFSSNSDYILNHNVVRKKDILEYANEVTWNKAKSIEGNFGSECFGVYFPNLIRRGWMLIGSEELGKFNSKTLFEKPIAKHWVLRKYCFGSGALRRKKGRGCYWDEHELFNTETGESIYFEDWEWADIDKGMVVFAENGCLYRKRIQSPNKLGESKLLHDFNNYKFEEIRAPYDDGWHP